MKRLETRKVEIGGNDYFITPFSAFFSANLSGEIINFVVPVAASIVPMIGETEDLTKIEINDENLSRFAEAFNRVNGDRVESLMRKLIVDRQNIAVSYYDNGRMIQEVLTAELADELFCMDIVSMYRLAWEVIMMNFGSFFEKALSRFGKKEDTETEEDIVTISA